MNGNEMIPPDPNDGWDRMEEAIKASMEHEEKKPPPIEWEGTEDAIKASLQDTATTANAADECEKKPTAKPHHQKEGNSNFVQFADDNNSLKSPDGVVSMDIDNFKPNKNSDVKSEHSPPPVRRHKNPSSVFDDAGPESGFFFDPYKKELVPSAKKSSSTTAAGTQHMLTGTGSAPKKLAAPKVPPQKLANAAAPPMEAPNLPAIHPTNRAEQPRWILSRKTTTSVDQMSPGVKPFADGNDDPNLLPGVFRFDMSAVQLGLDEITSRKSKDDIDFADFSRVAELARTPTTSQRNDANVQLYVPTEEMIERMCNTIDRVNIQYNPFSSCILCDQPAVTSRRAKPDDIKTGPGSHPLEFCMPCGKRELGDDCLDRPAACLCGEERFESCSECYTCRLYAPCRFDGCDKGGKGDTNPRSGLCPPHNLLQNSVLLERSRAVQECRRCKRALLHLRNSANGASKNICTVPPCATKCVIQDEENGDWCENDREVGCYCKYHNLLVNRKRNQERMDGTYKSDRWTNAEVELLTALMEQHRRSDAKRSVDWDAVTRDFNANPNFSRTKKQMKDKASGMQQKKAGKKNAKKNAKKKNG